MYKESLFYVELNFYNTIVSNAINTNIIAMWYRQRSRKILIVLQKETNKKKKSPTKQKTKTDPFKIDVIPKASVCKSYCKTRKYIQKNTIRLQGK